MKSRHVAGTYTKKKKSKLKLLLSSLMMKTEMEAMWVSPFYLGICESKSTKKIKKIKKIFIPDKGVVSCHTGSIPQICVAYRSSVPDFLKFLFI